MSPCDERREAPTHLLPVPRATHVAAKGDCVVEGSVVLLSPSTTTANPANGVHWPRGGLPVGGNRSWAASTASAAAAAAAAEVRDIFDGVLFTDRPVVWWEVATTVVVVGWVSGGMPVESFHGAASTVLRPIAIAWV